MYECFYIPPKVGQYIINITFGGQHITKSPFKVDVGPEKSSKIVAFGPGLEGGVVNQPACFTVETNGETGALGMCNIQSFNPFMPNGISHPYQLDKSILNLTLNTPITTKVVCFSRLLKCLRSLYG